MDATEELASWGISMNATKSERTNRPLHLGSALAFVVTLLCFQLIGAKPAQAQTPGLIQLIAEVQLSPRLYELTLTTPVLATLPGFILGANPTGQTKVRVLLPQGYDQKLKQRYPVLYLYHGGLGNQADWTSPGSKGDAEGATEALSLIVVMPEGGIAGGYADWYNNGAFGPPMWKTYHLEELMPWIDAHYRTIADRNARATAGLSMGGGGLRYAAQRPDLIGVTASFSGDIDITQPASDWRGAGAVISRLIWGDFTSQEVRWRGVNGPDLAKNLSSTDISIFAGDTGVPEGTYIHAAAVTMHQRLEQLGIDHQYTLYPGMSHTWTTFNKELVDWLPRLMKEFRKAANNESWERRHFSSCSPHSAFSYSAIAPTYSLYGWTVQMERIALEFSALEVTNNRYFSVVGSGSATVKTPKLNIPSNIQFRATITNVSNPGLSTSALVYTDSDGRLSVPVSLGIANPFQQYTAAANAASTGASADDVPFQLFNNGSRFYRANVRISATPKGLCQIITALSSHKGTTTSLCSLLDRFEKNRWRRNVGRESLNTFRQNVIGSAGEGITREQADTLLEWADTLQGQ